MERNYETVCIIKPDVGEEAVKGIIGKASDAVKKGGDGPFNVDEWGRRRLAYPINKNAEGYYVLFTYRTSPDAARELERLLKLNEDVMRFQTVRLEEAVAGPEEPESKEPEGQGGGDEQER